MRCRKLAISMKPSTLPKAPITILPYHLWIKNMRHPEFLEKKMFDGDEGARRAPSSPSNMSFKNSGYLMPMIPKQHVSF
jgi:hypothetical protein